MSRYIILFCIISSIVSHSYFNHPAQKYHDEYAWDNETLVLEWSQRLWIKGDEIRIGSTKIHANGDELLCHCKKPAQSISFKKGKLTALCEEHGIKRARPEIPEHLGKRSTITAKEFNRDK